MTIHKSVVLRFIVGRSASSNGVANHFIHFFSALGRQAHQNFCTLGGIANWVGCKFLELGFCQKHDEDVLAHNHTSGSFVSKLGVKTESKFSKKFDRPIEIFDW